MSRPTPGQSMNRGEWGVGAWVQAALAAVVSLSMTAGVSAQVTGLGVIGDSLSDEYFEESYSYARNWTVQLAQNRSVNLGPTAGAAGQSGGTWGEPRRTGYKFNFARYGADSSTAIGDGQVSGVAGLATAGEVSHAVVAIGANDFSPTTGAYFGIYWGLWSTSQTTSYAAAQASDIRAMVTSLQGAGAKVVLGTVVDFGIAPVTRSLYTNATRRQRVADAIALVNSEVRLMARQKRVVLIDLAGLATAMFGTHSAPRSSLTIGGVMINLLDRDTAAHERPLAGFVDDGAHPHTTLQGVFANVVIAAMNVHDGVAISALSEQEMLTGAGLTYVGPDALEAQVGSAGAYVRDYRCAANFNGVGGVGVQDIFDFLSAWFAASPEADVNMDASVGVQDIFSFLTAWFSGCA